ADLTGLSAPAEVSRGNVLVVSLPGVPGTMILVLLGPETDYQAVPGLLTPLLLRTWLVELGVVPNASSRRGLLSSPVPQDPPLHAQVEALAPAVLLPHRVHGRAFRGGAPLLPPAPYRRDPLELAGESRQGHQDQEQDRGRVPQHERRGSACGRCDQLERDQR